MTRKKIFSMVLAGIMLLFMTASVLNFGVAKEQLASDYHQFCNKLYYSSDTFRAYGEEPENYDFRLAKAGYTETETLLYNIIQYAYTDEDFPCAVAVADREGNLYFAPRNYFVAYFEKNGQILKYVISIDEYITEEFIKEFRKFSKGNFVFVDDLQVYDDGERIIPVSATFSCKGNTKLFVFSDHPASNLKSEYQNYCYFNEVNSSVYNRKYYDMLENEVRDRYEEVMAAENPWNGGGAYLSAEEAVGDNLISFGDNKDFKMFFASKYNIYLDALFSDDFRYLTINLAVMFSITGAIFLFLCLKLFAKSKKLEEAKATFISAASHELKTPIAVIQNRCECLMEDVAPEKKDRYLKAIHDEALRMDSIVASLLNYNRITQLTHIEKEKCDLTELLRQEIKSYLAFAQKRGVIFDVSGIERDVCAVCNVGLMKMAIDNYLSNAVKYVQGEKRVTVNLRKKEKGFIFEVINEADEISAADANEAWQELSKGDKSRQRQGTSIGMGLAICKRIFELHDYKGYSRYKDGSVAFVIEGN